MEPRWTTKEQRWFMALLEGMVSNPKAVNLGRRRSYFDLELLIRAAKEDEHIFTDEVLDALITLVTSVSGYCLPVIYLEGKPNAKAREQLDYAYTQV